MDKLLFVLGGAAWINLINTVYNSNKQQIDILADSASTLQWLKENNLLRDSDTQALENEDLHDSLIDELQSLRHLCKMILSDIEQQGKLSPNTMDQLKGLVNQVKVSLNITLRNETLKLVPEGKTISDHVLYNLVDSITHTLNSISINRIRKCEHQECSLYFVDTSKSGKRRWCSMELCGNRKKAAGFYARKKKNE